MINSILFMNLNPTPDNQSSKNGNGFIEVAKIVMSKANFTRAQWFYFGFAVLYTAFFVIMAVPNTTIYLAAIFKGMDLSELNSPVPLLELSIGLLIVYALGAIYFVLYSIPELRDRFNTKKK